MSNDDFIDIIYQLLLEKYDEFKGVDPIKSIDTYYDNENIEHIKIDLGYQTYIVSVD